MEVWQIAGVIISGAGLLAGAVGYLIRIERILTHLSTTIATFFAESTADRKNLWESHVKLQELQHVHGERLTAAETRIEQHHPIKRAAHG